MSDASEHALEVLAGRRAPVPARDAATVALLRDGAAGLEVHLLRRVRGMAFAAGMYVFPGGSVDPADADADIGWAGPPPAAWAAAFGTDEPTARALVCAAVRETFEESGVLLAGPSAATVVGDVAGPAWEAARRALEAGERSMTEVLRSHGLVLRADLLAPVAHWVTPEQEPKRFDTRFFAAALPAGQAVRDVGGEADDRVWTTPAAALATLTLMPPTRAVLTDLAAHRDVAAALGAPRRVSPVRPAFVLEHGELRLVMPDA